MAVAEQTKQHTEIAGEAQNKGSVALFQKPRIDYHPAIQQRFGIDQSGWRTLIDAIWPGAKTVDAICLALAYCKARRLDPFKRPVHIVPVWNSALGREVEGVWPGIGELRTTAFRTVGYAGADATNFGPVISKTFTGKTKKGGESLSATVTFPEWAQVTVYRIIQGHRVAFHGPRVFWVETFSGKYGTPVPNDRWCRAPSQMIEKCAEAAALRKAFPEEIGEQLTAEEMEGKIIEHDTTMAIADPQPTQQQGRPSRADFTAQTNPQTTEHGESKDVPQAEDKPTLELISAEGESLLGTSDATAFIAELAKLINGAAMAGDVKAIGTLTENNETALTAIGGDLEKEARGQIARAVVEAGKPKGKGK